MKRFFYLFVLLALFISCATKSKVPLKNGDDSKPNLIDSEVSLREKADMLAHKYIITDGHVDLPYRLKVQNFKLEREYLGIPVATDDGDFDYERAKKGGLDAPFMSIYIPASYQDGRAKSLADTLINMVNKFATDWPDKFIIATSPADVINQFSQKRISICLGMENGAPISEDINNLGYFYESYRSK